MVRLHPAKANSKAKNFFALNLCNFEVPKNLSETEFAFVFAIVQCKGACNRPKYSANYRIKSPHVYVCVYVF